jgi:hypothetical protein
VTIRSGESPHFVRMTERAHRDESRDDEESEGGSLSLSAEVCAPYRTPHQEWKDALGFSPTTLISGHGCSKDTLAKLSSANVRQVGLSGLALRTNHRNHIAKVRIAGRVRRPLEETLLVRGPFQGPRFRAKGAIWCARPRAGRGRFVRVR